MGTTIYPVLRQVNASEYEIVEDYVCYIRSLQKTLLIRHGFRYDGASIPRVLWGLIGSPFTGDYTVPALIHDALYAAELCDRKTSDLVFLDEMSIWQVCWWRRNSMYWGVRVGGGVAWDKHDPAQVETTKLQVMFMI